MHFFARGISQEIPQGCFPPSYLCFLFSFPLRTHFFGLISFTLTNLYLFVCCTYIRRVTPEMYQELATMTYEHGTIEYYETARIVSIQPHITATETTTTTTSEKVSSSSSAHVVVATAGTTDLPVAEEAAVTLEATGHVTVDRINDVGVAGLHRVLRSLPRLQKADCVIVYVRLLLFLTNAEVDRLIFQLYSWYWHHPDLSIPVCSFSTFSADASFSFFLSPVVLGWMVLCQVLWVV